MAKAGEGFGGLGHRGVFLRLLGVVPSFRCVKSSVYFGCLSPFEPLDAICILGVFLYLWWIFQQQKTSKSPLLGSKHLSWKEVEKERS